HAVRQRELQRHAARLEAGAERLQRRPGGLGQIDGLEAEVLAAREAEERGDLPLDALELAQDEAVLGGEGRCGLARELLREAPGGGHGVGISCAMRAASSPMAASFSACASERSTATVRASSSAAS